jgi:hypothetical protein
VGSSTSRHGVRRADRVAGVSARRHRQLLHGAIIFLVSQSLYEESVVDFHTTPIALLRSASRSCVFLSIVPRTFTRAFLAAELRNTRSTTPLLCTSSNSFIEQCKYQRFCANASSRRNAPRTPRYQTRFDRLDLHSDDPSLISQLRSVTSNNTPSVPRACSKRHTAETARGTMAFKRPSVHTNLQRLE